MTPNEEWAVAWVARQLDWEGTLANLRQDTRGKRVTRAVAEPPTVVGRARLLARRSLKRGGARTSPVRGMLDRVRTRRIPA
jgi:hypothetical protein